MIKVLCAPDSFKGSLSSSEACAAMEEGIARATEGRAEVVSLPLSDGGEGLVDAVTDATGGTKKRTVVSDPLDRPTEVFYGILGDGVTGVCEMASASGLTLLRENERNPLKTSTYGTGELIKNLLDEGVKKIVIGIGGSATNDGGLGMIRALGGVLYDQNGEKLTGRGEDLIRLADIDLTNLDARIQDTDFLIACDVDNPLTGKQGAAFVYGPQKGADLETVKALDMGLNHYADVIQQDLGIKIQDVPGSGAAGGLGAGLMAVLNGTLKPGIELVLDLVQFDGWLKTGFDLVLTGEGKLDGQTVRGKVPAGVAKRASQKKIPTIAIVGGIGDGAESVHQCGIVSYFSIVPSPMDETKAMTHGVGFLSQTTEQVIRTIIM